MFGYIAVWLSRGYRYFLRVVSLIVGLHTSMPPHTVGVLVPEAEMNSKIQQEIARRKSGTKNRIPWTVKRVGYRRLMLPRLLLIDFKKTLIDNRCEILCLHFDFVDITRD